MSRIITGLLALLGFAACEPGNGRVEYGQPHADFEVKGKVTDVDGDPIQGIKISAKWADAYDYHNPSVTTDSSGKYTLNDPYWWPDSGEIEVIAEDVDGEENGGSFATKIETITVKDSDYTGGSGGWYEGKLSKTADFTLELDDDENE